MLIASTKVLSEMKPESKRHELLVLDGPTSHTRNHPNRRVAIPPQFRVVLWALLVLVTVELVMYNILTRSDGVVTEIPIIGHGVALNLHDDKHLLKSPKKQLYGKAAVRASQTISERKVDMMNVSADVNQTVQVLLTMGVEVSELKEHLEEVPKWSQILENYGGKDEPVIVGLQHCKEYRRRTKLRDISIGPAGMFSTGTNLLNRLLKENCENPDKTKYGRKNPLKFNLHQVPWGKHNPAEARGAYMVEYMREYVENPMAVLPIVSIRHPYTWMSSMCRHGYGTQWTHNTQLCHKTLGLRSPVREVPYGAKSNGTHFIPNNYTSLAHMYMEWYSSYFYEQQYKRLMIRFEDLVFRPKEVVTRVCECVGGTIRSWKGKGKFVYKTKVSNKGPGHGQRSDLLTAFTKYGQPLDSFYAQYDAKDREITKKAFHGDEVDKTGIFQTFQYKLLR
mmetsp:Transcript_15499/g.28863  ORF Transcript_15499/g.28863 Transcript_15499/m.28863 type:complete len:449 (+) Transcript_15499:273-1619(+)